MCQPFGECKRSRPAKCTETALKIHSIFIDLLQCYIHHFRCQACEACTLCFKVALEWMFSHLWWTEPPFTVGTLVTTALSVSQSSDHTVPFACGVTKCYLGSKHLAGVLLVMAAAFCQDKQAVQAVWPGNGLMDYGGRMAQTHLAMHHGKWKSLVDRCLRFAPRCGLEGDGCMWSRTPRFARAPWVERRVGLWLFVHMRPSASAPQAAAAC